MLSLLKVRRTVRSMLRKIARSIDPPHPDQTVGNTTYSQHGEDVVLVTLFQSLGIEHPNYLDVGAHHPIHISNTALLYERGSRGVNVEANPNLIEAFHDLRPEDVTLNVAAGAVPGEIDFYLIDDFSGRNSCDLTVAQDFVRKNPQFKISGNIKVPVKTIKNIYLENFHPQKIDLMSIDVEGLDYHILESTFADGIFPTVIVVEIVCGGDSSQAVSMRDLLEKNGYFIFVRLEANYIGVRNELQPKLI